MATIERMRELRGVLGELSNQLCEIQSEIDEIERGVTIEEDVAKQRWEVGTQFRASRKLYIHDGEDVLVEQIDATPEQIRKMAGALEMLDMLEEVAKSAVVKDLVSEYVTVIPSGLLLGIKELIKKARGGEECEDTVQD